MWAVASLASQDVVAYHKVIEGRGCAKLPLPAKLKTFASDEDESLYIGSTQPTYAIEAEKKLVGILEGLCFG